MHTGLLVLLLVTTSPAIQAQEAQPVSPFIADVSPPFHPAPMDRTDVIVLTRGETIRGMILELDGSLLKIRVPAGRAMRVISVPLAKVARFTIDAPPEQEPATTPAPDNPRPRGLGWDTASNAPEAQPTAAAQPTEREDPAALIERLNLAQRNLTATERRAVSHYNRYLELKRTVLETRAEAYHLRTRAAERRVSNRERLQMLNRADALQDTADQLEIQQQKEWAAYQAARRHLTD